MTSRTTTGLLAIALSATGALGAQAATAAPSAAPSAATAATTSCDTPWGSLPKANSTMAAGPLTNIRSGRHTCFDRLVVDLRGKPAGYSVAYVSQIVQDGSGAVVPVRGGAKLQITVNASALNSSGQVVYQPANPKEAVNVTTYSTLRQVRWLGTFEGYSGIGVGVRARLPFRVFALSDAAGSRLVIDIAHRW